MSASITRTSPSGSGVSVIAGGQRGFGHRRRAAGFRSSPAGLPHLRRRKRPERQTTPRRRIPQVSSFVLVSKQVSGLKRRAMLHVFDSWRKIHRVLSTPGQAADGLGRRGPRRRRSPYETDFRRAVIPWCGPGKVCARRLHADRRAGPLGSFDRSGLRSAKLRGIESGPRRGRDAALRVTRSARDLRREVLQFDEGVGLAAQLVRDHRG